MIVITSQVTVGSVQVRSLTLDVRIWDEAVLGMMERIGNHVANEAWEAELVNENSRSALAFYSMLLPLNQCLCLSIHAFAFHSMRLPFTQCICLSHNASAFHSMRLPFKPICLPVNQCFGLSLNASVFHCEWQDLYSIQCTCQVNPHSSVQQELLASVCTAV